MGHDYRTKEYRSWRAMKTRCLWKAGYKWLSYGGRGITVCKRWINSFDTFLADMGPAPSNRHTLGRINNDGNYTPSNCQWETLSQQARNKRPVKLLDSDVWEIRWLKDHGLSNSEVGKVYGVSPSLVSMIHTGRRHPIAA